MSNNSSNSVVKMLFLISQIGITMMTTIFMCIGIGYAIDHFFHTKLLVWFVILGVVAGFKSVTILLKKIVNSEESENANYMSELNMAYNSDSEYESDEDKWKDDI